MSEPQKQSFQIFFAGASLAFGLPFLLIEVLSLLVGMEQYNQRPDLFGIIYITSYVFGGLVGGALVARKVEMKHIVRAGITTGFMGFLLQQVISFLFFGPSVIGDPYTMFALIGGTLAGSLYTRQNRKQMEKENEEAEEKKDIPEPEA